MPRTAKAETVLLKDTAVNSVAAGVYTTIDATLVTNGLTVTAAGNDNQRPLLLHVKNTAATAKIITVRANPRGTGTRPDLTFSVPATTGERIIRLGDDELYEQADTDYYIDFEAGTTGSIAVYRA